MRDRKIRVFFIIVILTVIQIEHYKVRGHISQNLSKVTDLILRDGDYTSELFSGNTSKNVRVRRDEGNTEKPREDLKLCPANKIDNSDSKCYQLTTDQSCLTTQNNISTLESEDLDNAFWVPLKRTTDLMFEPFQWISMPNLLLLDQHWDIQDNDIYWKQCVIYTNNQLIAVSCNETYSTLCVKYIIDETESGDEIKRPILDMCLISGHEYLEFITNTKLKDFYYTSYNCEINRIVQEQFRNKIIIVPKILDSQELWSQSKSNLQILLNSFTKGYALYNQDLGCTVCKNKIINEDVVIEIYFNESTHEIQGYVTGSSHIYHNTVFCYLENQFLMPYIFTETCYNAQLQTKLQNNEFKLYPFYTYPSIYLCTVFKVPTMEIIKSNKITAYWEDLEYTFFLVEFQVLENESLSPASFDFFTSIYKDLVKICYNLTFECSVPVRFGVIKKNECQDTDIFPNFLEVTHRGHNYFNVKYRYISYNFKNSVSQDRSILEQLLTLIPEYLKVISIKSTVYCLESKVNISGILLTFTETRIGHNTTSLELCLQSDYTPVLRKCLKDALNGEGYWGEIKGNCSSTIKISNITIALHDLHLNPNMEIPNLIMSLNKITKQFDNNTKAIDIYFTAKILEKILDKSEFHNLNPTVIIDTINNIVAVNKEILKNSQEILNSTDSILYSIDRLILNTDIEILSSSTIIISKIEMSHDTIGVKIERESSENGFPTFKFKPLFQTSLIEELASPNLEAAILLPKRNSSFYLFLFANDNLFNEGYQNDSLVASWITSILIPNDDQVIDNETIKIYFRQFDNFISHETCVHWHYGIDDFENPISGKWKKDGTSIDLNNSIFLCEVNHTTHFAMLVTDHIKFKHEVDDLILTVITYIGSSLSVIGILIIFITALFFKVWRKEKNNKIVLNLAFCLLLLIIFLFLAGAIRPGTWCIIIGLILHYIVIANFCWGLIICYSSYRRLYQVKNYSINNVILKYCILAWGLPLPIVFCTALISLGTYDKIQKTDLCYPKNDYFQFGIVLPLGVMITINLCVYIAIILNLSKKPSVVVEQNRNPTRTSLIHRHTILLFFILGITWTFGLLTLLFDSVIFAYIFSSTTTIEGFILFIFYIFFIPETKKLWEDRIKNVGGGPLSTSTNTMISEHSESNPIALSNLDSK